MNEIYWLTRLDAISDLMSVLMITSAITIALYVFMVTVVEPDFREEEGFKKKMENFKKIFHFSVVILIFSGLTITFLPTSKEAYMIWGVGGIIDYLKENETAKQIPDKIINAIDKFIDEK